MVPVEVLLDLCTRLEISRVQLPVAEFLGKVNSAGIDGPFNLYVGQDDKEATSYILHFVESGLGGAVSGSHTGAFTGAPTGSLSGAFQASLRAPIGLGGMPES